MDNELCYQDVVKVKSKVAVHLSDALGTTPDSDVLLTGFRGSIAHGMYLGGDAGIDDIDLITICFAPLGHYFGVHQDWGNRGTKEIWYDDGVCVLDSVQYELRKALGLLQSCNPNILSCLFLEDVYYFRMSALGRKLQNNRHLFLSNRAYHSFVNYAKNQLQKMTQPNQYAGYMGAKRKALVDQFGYDTKNAAHTIRLLRMGIELLSEGKCNVLRMDAEELLEIKQGHRSLSEIQAMSKDLLAKINSVKAASVLQDEPQEEKIAQLSMELLTEHFFGHTQLPRQRKSGSWVMPDASEAVISHPAFEVLYDR
jgi:uncharacterized protein